MDTDPLVQAARKDEKVVIVKAEGHEAQGTGYDSGARGHELQGRLRASDVAALEVAGVVPPSRPPLPTAKEADAAERAIQAQLWPPAETAFLVLDTETSGLPIYTEEVNGKKVTVAADDPRQPWLAQACMIALNESLEEVGRYAGYVKPDGWGMEPGATEANGLTTEFLLEHGKPVAEVLDRYEAVIHCGAVVVAHNAQFDCKLMRGALRRAGRLDLFEQTHNFCTMRMWAKMQGGKWPKLAQLCAYLQVDLRDRHTAVGDCEALVECMRKMRAIGFTFEGEVHRSKLRDDAQSV